MMQLLTNGVILFVAGIASAEAPSLITDRELSLGGVAINATHSSVLRKHGSPLRSVETGDFLNTRLDYPGLTVWLGEDGRVGEVLSISKRHCTPAGICPGTPFTKVKEKYGVPLLANREDGTYMEYQSSDSPCWLQIAVSKGIVKSVRAECQP